MIHGRSNGVHQQLHSRDAHLFHRIAGAGQWHRMLSLNDVTSDHYRSFTCIDGQQYLLAAMRRDKRFWPKPENAEISITTNEEVGHTEIFVPSADPKRFTDVEIELELDAGDWIELMSEVPLQGTIEMIEDDDAG